MHRTGDLMGNQIIKCARDEDLYLEWSSVTESPTAVGGRLEMTCHLDSDPRHAYGYSERTLALADDHGTSAWIRGCRWDSDGLRYRNGGLLPRDRMAEYARRLLDDPDAEPTDLLVPIDYGD
jgi:hypothetical protein